MFAVINQLKIASINGYGKMLLYFYRIRIIRMIIAGVDEVGRGPLAGAVVAAAVILDEVIEGVTDSKKLSPGKRSQLAELIKLKARSYAIGRAEVHEIDQLNIHHATLLAMKRAIEGLHLKPELIKVDGIHAPKVSIPTETIIQGDLTVYQIGAASILAKVYRDEEMIRLDLLYPGYGFADHKGYPTPAHRKALIQLGACEIHRRSYAPVAAALNNVSV